MIDSALDSQIAAKIRGRKRKALRRFVFRCAAVSAIVLAIGVSTLKLLLPWVAAHPEWIAAQLSQALGVPVTLQSAESSFASDLRLELNQLSVGSALSFNRASVSVDPLGFLPRRPWLKTLRINDLQLNVVQTETGWQLSGFGTQPEQLSIDWRRALNGVGRIALNNAVLRLQTLNGRKHHFSDVAIGLTRERGLLKIGLQLRPEKALPRLAVTDTERNVHASQLQGQSQGTIHAVLHLPDQPDLPDTDLADATLYLALQQVELDTLSAWLPAVVGESIQQGYLDGAAWLSFDAGRTATPQGLVWQRIRRGHVTLSARPSLPTDGAELFAFRSLRLQADSTDGADWFGSLQLDPNAQAQFNSKTTKRDAPKAVARTSARSAFAMRLPSVSRELAALELRDVNIQATAEVLLGLLNAKQALRLHGVNPRGTLSRLSLRQSEAGSELPWRGVVQLSDLSFKALDELPGLSGLDLTLRGHPDALSIAASASDFRLHVPKRFRREIPVQQMAARGAFWRDLSGWHLSVPEIALIDPDFDARAELLLEAPALPEVAAQNATAFGTPELQVKLIVKRGNVARAADFWDRARWSPRLLSWLDKALLSGQVVSGQALMRTPLKAKQFPFREHQGIFESQFSIANTELQFSPDWPKAKLDGSVFFRNNSMQSEQLSAQILATRVDTIQASIDDFKAPVLALDLRSAGDASALLEVIRQSPIGARYGQNFKDLVLSGPSTTSLSYSLPLRPNQGVAKLRGQTELQRVDLQSKTWRNDLQALQGSLQFDEKGFHTDRLEGQNLNSQILGVLQPISIYAAVGDSHTQVAKRSVNVELRGAMSAKSMFADLAALDPIVAASSGEANWTVQVRTDQQANQSTQTTLLLQSDLRGIALNLPAPLGKSQSQSRQLSAVIPLEESGRMLSVTVDDNVRYSAFSEYLTQPYRAELRLGDGSLRADREIPARGLSLRGSLAEANWPAWFTLGSAYAALKPQDGALSATLNDIKLDLRESNSGALGAPGNANLQFLPEQNGWTAKIQSKDIDGTLRYRSAERSAPQLDAQFDKLHWPETPERALPDPGDTSLTDSVVPTALPELHVYIKDFQLGAARLGETRLETFPVEGGMRIDLLQCKSPLLTLEANGTWLARGLGSQSQLNMRFSAEDLGKMLSGLGFAGHVAGGQTQVQMDANWAGAPHELNWRKLQGSMKVWVGSGRFLEVNPGAGRVFGLLSLRELPRRLALDFRDFFQSGMSFNEITGTFLFNAGNAYTQDLQITSPAADILVSGRTGLSSRDYQQVALVNPKVGMLPLVGAVAAGPAGAAAGLLAQGILESESAFAVSYDIGGSWEKPSVAKRKTSDTIQAQQ